jgi:hypothetical protein
MRRTERRGKIKKKYANHEFRVLIQCTPAHPTNGIAVKTTLARSLRIQLTDLLICLHQEKQRMSKQVITTHGEQHLVREDTAKSFRGVYWALFSLAAFIIIAAILFFGGFLRSLTGSSVDSPAEIERQTGR